MIVLLWGIRRKGGRTMGKVWFGRGRLSGFRYFRWDGQVRYMTTVSGKEGKREKANAYKSLGMIDGRLHELDRSVMVRSAMIN